MTKNDLDQPLAIVGIGCRLPTHTHSFAAFRAALAAGRSMVRAVPADRWNAERLYHPDPRRPGRLHATRGGFVDDVDQFDAAFFGLGPAEAARMDPQQRWILETAYRALEDAGRPLEDIAGERVAVIVGVSARDYDAVQTTAEDRHRIGASTNTGSASSIVANRVSYLFDLRGPSFVVDTACSSALTALHLAAGAIRRGDATSALVGGVNLVLRPEPSIGFSQGGYLSPDGECRAFSDDANGYVRGEGAAMVWIRPLEDALRDGDRIHAVLRATASNQDGHSLGMTAPSVEAQVELLQTAYARAGVDPRAVSYLEAHGTGTRAGDPIEATAIGEVLGRGRTVPLPIGSGKTMFGHLESAAGMVGLLRLIATLSDRRLYPNLCFRAPNPDIPFDELGLRVVTEAGELPATGPLLGGVNAFGFGGANAHAVLESPPQPTEPMRSSTDLPTRLFFSAPTIEATRALAGALAADLPDPRALVQARSSFESRFVVSGSNPAQLRERLSRVASGEDGVGVQTARLRDPGRVPVVFVFGGQGPQWHAMGRELAGTDPHYAQALDEVGAALARHGWSGGDPEGLRRELSRSADDSRMGETRIAQPCLFALQVGLARVLGAHGVVPAAVTGHSIGELAAAHVSGALTLDEAARLVVARSRSQARAEGSGCMAAVDARPAELDDLLEPGRVEVAAFNGPTSLTVAGDTEAVHALGAWAEQEGRFFRILDVSVPFHCHLMDPVRSDFLALAGDVGCRTSAVPFVSTVTGGAVPGSALDAAYFWRNIREPVRLVDALDTLFDDGHTLFVELGPHAILRRGAEASAQARGLTITWQPTLNRDGRDRDHLDACVEGLYLAGARAWPSSGGGAVPPIPFVRTRHWNESDVAARRRRGEEQPDHPHVAEVVRTGVGLTRARLWLDAAVQPYLADHVVQGALVFPGAGQLELCAALEPDAEIEGLSFRLPIHVSEGGSTLAVEAVGADGDFAIVSERDGARVIHSRGRFNRHGDPLSTEDLDLEALRARIGDDVSPGELYDTAWRAGLELGPRFRGISGFWVCGEEALARLEVPADLEADLRDFVLHPAILDSAIQTAALGTLSGEAAGGRLPQLFLPASVGRFRILRSHDGGPLWCHARRRTATDRQVVADVRIADATGTLVAVVEGLQLRSVGGADRARVLRATKAYAFGARPAPSAPPVAGGTWRVLGDSALASSVRSRLISAGAQLQDEGPLEALIDLSALDDGPLPAQLARLAQLATRARRVHVVTREADLARGAWTGLTRVLMSELPTCDVALIVAADADDRTVARWCTAALPADTELCIRADGAEALRIERAGPPAAAPMVDLDRHDVCAVVTEPGVVSSIGWERAHAPQPGAGEVVVDVEAVGLNFKDVVVAAGMMPERAWHGGLTSTELGLDFAGTVRAVGPGTSLSVGDAVLGMGRHSLSSFVVADERLTVRRPESLTVDRAAALPTVFLTALIALEELARVRAGETVLVHSGAGGVGQAAIQIAQGRGARVIASAGSPQRRARLEAQGVHATVSSRSPRFREEVLEATEGRGVDVVLNSLAGELLIQGMRCLAPFGRFVEIGKADLYENNPVGLEVFGENRALFGLDVNRWASQAPARLGALLAEVVRRVDVGQLQVPPVQTEPFERASDALQGLVRGKYVGKVVATRCARVPTVRPARFEASGTVIVTGGTSGFGLAIARWLASRGAAHLVLVSRRGTVAPEDRGMLDDLTRSGAEVTLASVDVTEPRQVDALVAAHSETLTGVVHGAMVLDDAPLADHDEARFARVLAPKCEGALNLHRSTGDLPLRWFVVISSIAAAVGTPGQAAYAAANGFLDGFAAHRRELGLPATAVAFGPLGDVGVVARASAEDRRKILAQGADALPLGEALALLEGALLEDVTHRVAAAVDWPRLTARLGSVRFAHLAEVAETPGSLSLLDALARLAPEERVAAVAEGLAVLAARLVGADEVDLDTPLSRVGLDSLVGTQLSARVQADYGVAVPLMRILRGPTVRELAEEVAPQLGVTEAHQWVRRAAGGDVRARLFCFPPLGGDRSAFDAWQARLPADLEVCTVDLPLDIQALGTVDALRERLVAELRPLCGVPFALYGHSVGGWVAMEVAAALAGAGADARFVALGAVPTQELLRSLLPAEGSAPVGDAEALRVLRSLDVPEGLLHDPETRARLIAMARRDLWLGARSRLAAPGYAGEVMVLWGQADALDTLGAADVEALGLNCTTRVEIPGGHLFHQDPAVQARLADLVSAPFAPEVRR